MQDAWVEQMEQTLNPMAVPMDNPIGTIESKDRQAILAALLVHLWHGYRKMRDCLMELEDAMLQATASRPGRSFGRSRDFAGRLFAMRRMLSCLRSIITSAVNSFVN